MFQLRRSAALKGQKTKTNTRPKQAAPMAAGWSQTSDPPQMGRAERIDHAQGQIRMRDGLQAERAKREMEICERSGVLPFLPEIDEARRDYVIATSKAAQTLSIERFQMSQNRWHETVRRHEERMAERRRLDISIVTFGTVRPFMFSTRDMAPTTTKMSVAKPAAAPAVCAPAKARKAKTKIPSLAQAWEWLTDGKEWRRTVAWFVQFRSKSTAH